MGGLIASVVAKSICTRVGIGRTIVLAAILEGAGLLAVPALTGPSSWTMPVLIVGELMVSFGSTLYGINQMVVQQSLVPSQLIGRVTAGSRMLVLGISPVGALVGGVLAEVIGVRGALFVAGIGSTLAAGWVYFSDVRGLGVDGL